MSQLVAVLRVNPHLPHDSVELQSPPPPDALDNDMALKNARTIVSRILHQEAPEPTGQPATGGTAVTAVTAEEGRRAGPPPTHPVIAPDRPRGAACLPDLAPAQAEAALREALTAEVCGAAKRSVAIRPRPVHGVIVACALCLVLWPVGFAVVLLALALAVIAGVALLRRAAARGGWRRIARRHPRTAERLRRRADRAAETLDRVLDLLPDRLAERLALPDLSGPQAGDRRRR